MVGKAGQLIERGKNRWLVRVFLGRDKSGKRRYLNRTIHGSKKVAQATLTKLLREKDTGALVEPSRTTVGEYLDHWLEAAVKPRVSPRTYADYTGLITRYIEPELGSRRLSAVSPIEIQSFYGKLLNKGLSARTVRYVHSVLRNALSQAVKWRYLHQNPAVFVGLPKLQSSEMVALSTDEVQQFLGAARGSRHELLFNVLLATGLRPGEALGLQWQDIDFTAMSLSVVRSVSRNGNGQVTLASPKTMKSRRRLPIPASLGAMLLQEKELRDIQAEQTQIFTTEKGEIFHPDNFPRRHFKDLIERAGINRRVRLYDLRHTHATLLLLAGVHPKVVSERLGHSSITLTLDTYSHVLPSMQQDASDRLENMLYSEKAARTVPTYN